MHRKLVKQDCSNQSRRTLRLASLIIQVRHDGEWLAPGNPLAAGQRDGSLSHNGPAGCFALPGWASAPSLNRLAGADIELGDGPRDFARSFDPIAELRPGDDPLFECFLRTDRMVSTSSSASATSRSGEPGSERGDELASRGLPARAELATGSRIRSCSQRTVQEATADQEARAASNSPQMSVRKYADVHAILETVDTGR